MINTFNNIIYCFCRYRCLCSNSVYSEWRSCTSTQHRWTEKHLTIHMCLSEHSSRKHLFCICTDCLQRERGRGGEREREGAAEIKGDGLYGSDSCLVTITQRFSSEESLLYKEIGLSCCFTPVFSDRMMKYLLWWWIFIFFHFFLYLKEVHFDLFSFLKHIFI